MANSDLQTARANKADEFYTSFEDIEKEISYYPSDIWKDKIVYLPCDNCNESAFYKFFQNNFERLSLKKLITTSYAEDENGLKSVCYGKNTFISPLNGNGDFASEECQNIMKECDIVVTNPPFSKFRDFISQIIDLKKRFLILGNINAVTYKEVFPHIVSGKIKIGPSVRSGDRNFRVPDDYPLEGTACSEIEGIKYIRVKGVRWFTDLKFKDTEDIRPGILTKTLKDLEVKKFDTYPDAININSAKEIPVDYSGLMGVPITVLDKTDSSGLIKMFDDINKKDLTFKVIGMLNSGNRQNFDFAKPVIDGKCKFKRLLIKKIK